MTGAIGADIGDKVSPVVIDRNCRSNELINLDGFRYIDERQVQSLSFLVSRLFMTMSYSLKR